MNKKFCVFFDFSSAPALKKPEVEVSELFGADNSAVVSNNKVPKAKSFSNFLISRLSSYILFNIFTLGQSKTLQIIVFARFVFNPKSLS